MAGDLPGGHRLVRRARLRFDGAGPAELAIIASLLAGGATLVAAALAGG